MGNDGEALTGGMPKSRGRNGRRNRPSTNNRNARLRARAKQRAELEPYIAAIKAANEREAAGDASGALDVIAKTPCGPDGAFMWAPWRMDRLGQLSFAAPVVPRWAHARWMVAQCVIQLGRSALDRTHRAVAKAVEAQRKSPIGLSVDRHTWISDHDWIAHQLAVHDLGGLTEFLESKPAVANLAGDVSSWADAPMKGYRLERETDHEIVWSDVASGEEVTTINIGTATRASGRDRCVIGRVVACDGVRLFAIPPAGVSLELARAVSTNPADWLAQVTESNEAFTISALSKAQDAPLLTDVFDNEWCDELIDSFELECWELDEDGGVTEPSPEELDRLTAEAILGHVLRRDPDMWINAPHVGAALLCFGVWAELVSRTGPEHAQGLAELAQRLVGPPADMCRQLGSSLRESA